MSYDPLHVIAEILGQPAQYMRNPANADYQCPFLSGACTKSSQGLTTPYPVCSVYRSARHGVKSEREPICICPNRFYEAQIRDDVLREAWIGDRPSDPEVAYEVTMQKFGRVDFVLADYDRHARQIRKFLPVELQAVDITRTVLPAYVSVITSTALTDRPQYGFNWSNVRKRYISQLIAKGYYCHHWGTRIVAVLQEDLFDEFQKHARLPSVALADANIIFMLYQFRWRADSGRWELELARVVPTTHVQVMNAILYETPPDRAKFESRVIASIHRYEAPPGVGVVETVGEIETEPDNEGT